PGPVEGGVRYADHPVEVGLQPGVPVAGPDLGEVGRRTQVEPDELVDLGPRALGQATASPGAGLLQAVPFRPIMLDERVDIHRGCDPACYQNERRHGARREGTGAATMSIQRHSIVTPEAVAVRVDIAELGSRVGAGLIDGLILGGVLTAILILAGLAGTVGLLGLG